MSKEDLIAPMREAHARGEYVLGTPFKVHTIDRGTQESMQRQAHNLRSHLLAWLDGWFELGQFSVSAIKDPTGAYDIFVTYYGEAKTVQSKGRWKAKRRGERRTRGTT